MLWILITLLVTAGVSIGQTSTDRILMRGITSVDFVVQLNARPAIKEVLPSEDTLTAQLEAGLRKAGFSIEKVTADNFDNNAIVQLTISAISASPHDPPVALALSTSLELFRTAYGPDKKEPGTAIVWHYSNIHVMGNGVVRQGLREWLDKALDVLTNAYLKENPKTK